MMPMFIMRMEKRVGTSGGTMRTENTRIGRIVALALLTMLLVGASGARGEEQKESRDILPAYFPYPAALRPQVEFWKKIFTTYSKYHAVIHDSENMKIYKVLDFRPLVDEEELDEATVNEIKKERTKAEVEQVRAILLKLHQCSDGCQNLSMEEQQIW